MAYDPADYTCMQRRFDAIRRLAAGVSGNPDTAPDVRALAQGMCDLCDFVRATHYKTWCLRRDLFTRLDEILSKRAA